MPRLSDSMEEGTILRWLKSVGDEVKRGDELVEIETDKANMTYEASDEGVLVEIVAQEGDTLPIGEVIARIGAAGEAEKVGEAVGAPAGKAASDGKAAAAAERTEAPPRPPEPPPSRPSPAERVRPRQDADGRVKASPVARRMAGELGVELHGVEG